MEGKCIAPTTWVKGCVKYDEKGKCRHCGYDTEPVENKCDNSVTCETGEKKIEYCLSWKLDFIRILMAFVLVMMELKMIMILLRELKSNMIG